jgi:hypothetical protein
MEARTPIGFGSRKVGLQAAPFGIGEVGLVCFSHARYPTEHEPQNPFSGSFMTDFSEVGRASLGEH